MAIVRRPRSEVAPVRSFIDRFFEEPFVIRPWALSDVDDGTMPLDMFEDGDDIVVRAALPGMKRDDVHVEIEPDAVHIWGEMRTETKRDDASSYMREIRYGRFDRRAPLPQPVKPDGVKAEYHDGMLTVRMPRAEPQRARAVEVKVH